MDRSQDLKLEADDVVQESHTSVEPRRAWALASI
jgi:hypothetical protein